jgi:predicted secreted protein
MKGVKMKSYVSFIFILSSVLGNCSQPSSPIDQTLDSSVNGKTIYYTLNSNFTLTLDLNADAGYQWDYSITDTNIVKIDSTCFVPKSGNPDQIGGVTIETFYFCTMTTGQSKISFVERHSWDSDEMPPNNSISFTVSLTD